MAYHHSMVSDVQDIIAEAKAIENIKQGCNNSILNEWITTVWYVK